MMRSVRNIFTAGLLAAVLPLAGCFGGGEEEPDASESPLTADVVDIRDNPGSVDGYVGALEDAEVDRCVAEGSAVLASGTVSNPLAEAQSYRLYVSVLDRGDTVAIVQVDVPDVAGGESSTWEADAAVSGGDISCILRVERFAP